ncbi:g2875 [Coccomyxa elongata]
MMTSSVMRNLPTLVLAITVALSLFYLWKTLNVIDGRVGRLEHEVMCVVEVVNHMGVQPAEPAQREAEVEVHPKNGVMADEASSVGEADVEIINLVGHEAHPGKHDLMQRFHTDASSASKDGEEDFLSLQKHLQGARQPPPEGEGSETTDASALQSLSTRKRVPSFSASSPWLHLGSRVTHNG